MQPKLWLVIPCYNEEEMLGISIGIIRNKLRSLIDSGLVSDESKILFVDDGSVD